MDPPFECRVDAALSVDTDVEVPEVQRIVTLSAAAPAFVPAASSSPPSAIPVVGASRSRSSSSVASSVSAVSWEGMEEVATSVAYWPPPTEAETRPMDGEFSPAKMKDLVGRLERGEKLARPLLPLFLERGCGVAHFPIEAPSMLAKYNAWMVRD